MSAADPLNDERRDEDEAANGSLFDGLNDKGIRREASRHAQQPLRSLPREQVGVRPKVSIFQASNAKITLGQGFRLPHPLERLSSDNDLAPVLFCTLPQRIPILLSSAAVVLKYRCLPLPPLGGRAAIPRPVSF